MDVLIQVLGVLLMLVGLAGCLLPVLPGPPLCFLALLIQQLHSNPPFTTRFLVIWGGVSVVVTILDYLIPLYGTRRFGGSRWGMWGCTVGLVVGLFFPPWGLILGPFAGAFVGELMGKSRSAHAFRAALGSFAGFLLGTLLKFIACLVMAWHLVRAMF